MPRSEQKWPDTLWIVRHGQSAGNVARESAELELLTHIDIATRDVDTPLSELGTQQALALGRWLATLPAAAQPTVILGSPFVRAATTIQHLLSTAHLDMNAVTVRLDERLREKEFGILDRLTKLGIREKYPELAEQRAHVGKFYFRPPGGESWCDVLLRLRSVIDMLTRDYRKERVLIVAHQVIVNCFRYLLERLDEAQILEIDRQADVPNCAVTSYEFDASKGRNGKMILKLVNFTAPLEEAGAPVTAARDTPTTKSVGA
jgi:broad specificity phosphatase PhoE